MYVAKQNGIRTTPTEGAVGSVELALHPNLKKFWFCDLRQDSESASFSAPSFAKMKLQCPFHRSVTMIKLSDFTKHIIIVFLPIGYI